VIHRRELFSHFHLAMRRGNLETSVCGNERRETTGEREGALPAL